MKKAAKWIGGGIAIVLVIVLITYWDAIRLIARGNLNDVIKKTEKVAYHGNTVDNLKAIQTALMLYHDNEDHFPDASGWMDAIAPMMRTNDLKEGEEWNKLKNPALSPLSAEEFGFSFNAAASGKNKADLKPDFVIAFESPDDKKKNASGDPASGKGKKITVNGKVE